MYRPKIGQGELTRWLCYCGVFEAAELILDFRVSWALEIVYSALTSTSGWVCRAVTSGSWCYAKNIENLSTFVLDIVHSAFAQATQPAWICMASSLELPLYSRYPSSPLHTPSARRAASSHEFRYQYAVNILHLTARMSLEEATSAAPTTRSQLLLLRANAKDCEPMRGLIHHSIM